jgi:hypothetical protein
MRYRLGLTAVLATTFLASLAHAQIGERKTFVFGADRVLGYTSSKITTDPEGPAGETSVRRGNLALFSQQDVVSPFTNPRFAFDYFLTDGLSLGGTIGYWSQSGEVETGTERDLPDPHLFTIAPRVGYAVMFGRVLGIWPRAGLTFFTGESSLGASGLNAEAEVSGLGMNLDLPFVIVPAPHFAILVGPGLDLTLTGQAEQGTLEHDLTIFDLGLHVGFVGYL